MLGHDRLESDSWVSSALEGYDLLKKDVLAQAAAEDSHRANS